MFSFMKRFKDALASKFNQWRINRYIAFREEGYSQIQSLRKAWLRSKTALRVVYTVLDANLSTVGILFYSKSGGFSTPMNHGQISLVLYLLADLYLVVPEESQNKIRQDLEQLCEHNWGFVRTPAMSALSTVRRYITLPDKE